MLKLERRLPMFTISFYLGLILVPGQGSLKTIQEFFKFCSTKTIASKCIWNLRGGLKEIKERKTKPIQENDKNRNIIIQNKNTELKLECIFIV